MLTMMFAVGDTIQSPSPLVIARQPKQAEAISADIPEIASLRSQ
jgi:hypothetical protein